METANTGLIETNEIPLKWLFCSPTKDDAVRSQRVLVILPIPVKMQEGVIKGDNVHIAEKNSIAKLQHWAQNAEFQP